ncbi:MAG: cell division protein FtsX [bacterium]
MSGKVPRTDSQPAPVKARKRFQIAHRVWVFLYSLQDGVHNLRRGGITGFVSVITISFTMLNVGLFFLLWINISPLLTGCLDAVKVVAYLKEGIGEERVVLLTSQLNAMKEIKKVTFVTKSEAMERFRESLGEDRFLLEGLGENPLPASFEMIIDDTAGIGALDMVAEKLSLFGEFEEIQSGREWVRRLSVFLFLIKVVGFLAGGVLIFVSLFIISNTVRLTFLNRKDEVEIMRLVGAHRWFIKTPFLLEGMINGLLGSVISIGLLYLLYQLIRYQLHPYLLDIIGLFRLSFLPPTLMLLLAGLGMGVGGVGSLFSLKV